MEDIPLYSENILVIQFKYFFTVKWMISFLMVLCFWMHSCSCTMALLCPVLEFKTNCQITHIHKVVSCVWLKTWRYWLWRSALGLCRSWSDLGMGFADFIKRLFFNNLDIKLWDISEWNKVAFFAWSSTRLIMKGSAYW